VSRLFLLSPAETTGKRGTLLGNPASSASLARRLQSGEGVPLGEIFSFVSGLYFRGKMAYVRKFAGPGQPFVITSNQGLVDVDQTFTLPEFLGFSEVNIHPGSESYRRPLEIDLAALAKGSVEQFILLGSIASPKYSRILLPFLGSRLMVPKAFHGLGDMARGSLLLRHAAHGEEMEYVALADLLSRSKR